MRTMSDKFLQSDSPAAGLKNEASRRRWELFHRAITYAKQSNVAAMRELDDAGAESKRPGPVLSVVR